MCVVSLSVHVYFYTARLPRIECVCAINSKNTPFCFVCHQKTQHSVVHSNRQPRSRSQPPSAPASRHTTIPPLIALCLLWCHLNGATALIVPNNANGFYTYLCDNEANITAQLDRTCDINVQRQMLTQPLLFRSHSQPQRIKCVKCDVGTLHERAGLRFSMDAQTVDLTGSHVEHVEAGSIAGTVHTLLLSYNTLTTLDDVKVFGRMAQLRTLHLDHNGLFYVDDRALDGLPELRELWLNHNRIVAVVARLFQHLPQLQKLRLHSNRLRQLDGDLLAGCPRLRELTLYDNQLALVHDDMWSIIKRIASLDIVNVQIQLNAAADAARMATLPDEQQHGPADPDAEKERRRQFDAVSCRIASMNLHMAEQHLYNRSCGNLTEMPPAAELVNKRYKYLNLRHNQIGDLDQNAFDTSDANTSALLTIDLTHNVIESVHPNAFDAVAGLKELLLGHNSIRYLAERLFIRLGNLLVLELHHNQLHTINAQQFWHTRRLLRLQLHNNSIGSVGEKAFDQLQRLELFDMSDNFVQSNVLILLNAQVVLLDRSNITRLHIGDRVCRLQATENRLRSLNLRNAHRLVHLNVSDNRIEAVDLLATRSLKTVDMSGNRLVEIDFEHNALLSDVQLADNLLTCVHFKSTAQLRRLDVSVNRLQTVELPTANMYQLHWLNVSMNRLQSLQSLHGLYTLRELDASDNPLAAVRVTTFQNMESLETLLLRRCELEHLEPGTFRQLHALLELDLSDNNLTELPVLATFGAGLRLLQQLRLNGNRLESLDAGALRATLPKLRTIDVSGNQWLCDVLAGFVRRMTLAYVEVQAEWESVVDAGVHDGDQCTANGWQLDADEDEGERLTGSDEHLTADEGNGTVAETLATGSAVAWRFSSAMLMLMCAWYCVR